MRRRLFSLILVISLLFTLAACADVEQEGESENTTQAEQTTQPTADGSFLLGRLPDEFAVPSSAKKPVRLYSGYTDSFIASEAYGAVYIYEGCVAVCSNEAGQTVQVPRYGLCTGRGEIITDAAFSEAYPITLADGTVYYVLEKLDRIVSDSKAETEITVFFVSVDGKWSSGIYTAVGDRIDVSALNNGGLCIRVGLDGEFRKCYILNKNCDVLKFISSSEKVSYIFGEFSEGLCPVERTENGKTEAYYIDVNGEKLFGGFSEAGRFSGSRAAVRNKGGDILVINSSGNVIVGPFDYTVTNVGSYYICKDKTTGGTAVYDSSGGLRRVIETSGEVSVMGKTVPVVFEQSTGTYYSVLTGTALRCHNTGEAATEYLGFGDYYVYYGKSEDGMTTANILNSNGDFVYAVYDFGGIVAYGFESDIVAVSSGTNNGKIRLISLATRSMKAEISASEAVPADKNGKFVQCIQTDESGAAVKNIYRLSDMSLLAGDVDEASVTVAGELVFVNSRKNGRLILLASDGTVLLNMPDAMSD